MQRAISVFDLLNWESTREVVLSGDREKLNNLLFELGFDLKEDIVEEECYHRPMHKNELMFGIRWVGRERTDEQWLSDEVCSYDNKLERIGLEDVELQRDLLKMYTVPSIMDKMIASMGEWHSAGTENLE